MSIIIDDLDARLGARIKTEREVRGWSLSDLAQRSGVSRAMINKVERGEASPTASLLGRLSGAFGLTLSTLLARTESAASGRLMRATDQMLWRDPATGYIRRHIAPAPGSDLPLDVVKVDLPAGASVSFPAASRSFTRETIWVLDGCLTFLEEEIEYRLAPGDCLETAQATSSTFRNDTDRPCTYVVIVLRSAS
ncbi:MAG TPA: XRE family transcriptional regulator [Stellaceae bacterium]|nr:XRE family transcriptional regulator [Stellaceae bacterium]